MSTATEMVPLLLPKEYLLQFFEQNEAQHRGKPEEKEDAIKDITAQKLRDWAARGADVNAENRHKRRTIHYVVKLERPDLLDALLALGAKPDVTEQDGYTPLALAEKLQRKANVALLRRALTT